jgi:hypothetical protein
MPARVVKPKPCLELKLCLEQLYDLITSEQLYDLTASEQLYDRLASEQLKAELASSACKEGCQTPTKTSTQTGRTKKRKEAAKRRLLKAPWGFVVGGSSA